MATEQGINNREHQNENVIGRKIFRSLQSASWLRLSYTKIVKPDPFDSSVRYTPKLKAFANSVQVQRA